ncbi:hypothetical protein [Nocardia sp. NPDC003345]
MDLDRIGTRTAEIAESLGVRTPRVVAGKVPAYATERVRHSFYKRRPTLTVGAGFDDLPPIEQDGALANALVVTDLVRKGQTKAALAYAVPAVAVGYPLLYLSILHGNPVWATLSAFIVLYVCGHLLTFGLRFRRIGYRVDRTVAEAMGREVVDAMIDHDIRNRPSLPVLARLYYTIYWPSEARRARRLDATFGPPAVAQSADNSPAA